MAAGLKQTKTMKVFQIITEVFGWLQIVASPFLAGLVIGGIVYLPKGDIVGLSIGIIIALIGLITGIILATRVWRKKGTVNFMSRLSATPELEEKEAE
jgi:uncharacterized membrane protein YjjP (DUF1212 family)